MLTRFNQTFTKFQKQSNRYIQAAPDILDGFSKGTRIADRKSASVDPLCNCDGGELKPCSKSSNCQLRVTDIPFHIRTYGCQMNQNDSAIVGSIMEEYGYKMVDVESQAEIQLIMTCAIRTSAEAKIWTKLNTLKNHKNNPNHRLRQIGLLGCMAERIKERVLDQSDGCVDIVAGPDAYRQLPRLFAINRMTNDKAVNCLLSMDETYSDIRPVTKIGDVSAFVSITRGCDNLCSYCIVPFTRGRERSRPIKTILDEVRELVSRGIKDVTLLGQNVNSYRDLVTPIESLGKSTNESCLGKKQFPAEGFSTVYKPRDRGISFDVLLDEVAKLSPEIRVRFTSPHPKDFTDEVIEVMARNRNICRCIHLPAQSGSDRMLAMMRRGYTRAAYLKLVSKIKDAIPEMEFTSDFIAGFCGEKEEDHIQSVELLRQLKYLYVYAFPYSSRDKTSAFYNLTDDVDREIKLARSNELVDLFREQAKEAKKRMIGTEQLVLVDMVSKRSDNDWRGLTDAGIKTILPKTQINVSDSDEVRDIKPGDYVVCKILESSSETFRAWPIKITTQYDYYRQRDS